ncbi:MULTISPECIES: proton-conducting transporter transmembrane domain-containing protein [Holospora]|uniref:NAD(P)H-quinone oxidoreductase subunit 5, chloroplastic n=2 Tax=Holospora TaxID=44747 RepID=A0A061JIU9_9PROT|nr:MULTISPECIES: proton-conducting transporter membrane subunit [Holospora]ETZ05194.1 NAD(P)H-quinone oxidoreductase subunit 5, chloroplastic [Holospora undulata HU1]GAJ46657.1 NAD(P)H-quinone oxidoreductase subunit 5, chloroplastic [Holospora elegans E1]
MSIALVKNLFYVDVLAIAMMVLIGFLGTVVCLFSKEYMKGDALYNNFFLNMSVLLTSVILITISDNLVVFLSAWGCCNGMTARLMTHKPSWKAARASGRLAFKNFVLGFIFIATSFILLYKETESLSIQYIVHHSSNSIFIFCALIMLILGAMTQSAIYPFHRWLISSLNSPTPVSAIMHAGIINGGGFLLARFSPLYFNFPKILNVIFVVGLVSALLGSVWKLMQADVKRMLGCSTMGQMGFMLVQCGLGLFSSAIAHLCWHGVFKAYLFLSSGGAAKEERVDLGYPPRLHCFLLALVCGFWGSYLFTVINDQSFFSFDTTCFVIGIVFITSTQLALTTLFKVSFKNFFLALLIATMVAVLYGINVYVFDSIFSPLGFMQPQPLNLLHSSALIIPVLWVLILFFSRLKSEIPDRFLILYVKMLNSSQPCSATVTACHKGYNRI